MNKTHARFTEKVRAEYRKIRNVRCTALLGERVYFNRHGFNHLLRKGRRLRNEEEQKRRLELVTSAPLILAKAQSIYKYEQISHKGSIAQFWNLSGRIVFGRVNMMAHVIVRKLNNGRMHFFSIYDKKK